VLAMWMCLVEHCRLLYLGDRHFEHSTDLFNRAQTKLRRAAHASQSAADVHAHAWTDGELHAGPQRVLSLLAGIVDSVRRATVRTPAAWTLSLDY
jgi:hypothetical protein